MATKESQHAPASHDLPASPHDETAKTLGRRELNRMATTEGIVNACLDLGEELGWDAVTVDAVAERAGISRRTFFNYFSSLAEAVHYPLTVIIQDASRRVSDTGAATANLATHPGSEDQHIETGEPLDYAQALAASIRLELLIPATRTLLLTRASAQLRTESLRTWENNVTQLLEATQHLSPKARFVAEVQVRAAVSAAQVAFEHWAAALSHRPTKADVEALRRDIGRAVSLVSPTDMLPTSNTDTTHLTWPDWLTNDEREEIYEAFKVGGPGNPVTLNASTQARRNS
ncbi:helix-turn-helix domain-containing protein [Pseudoglutamicibacter cumminsii]|uniref:TetR/AcrR family transcriptional regulator n=1 Tax=Pseudoglutamicibacter cumminsii TaxID=156979 RepID=UPI0025523D3D|nr:TetR/AcrR family transcriptional regulator [Pseudoglutamicibacter cumminsii]MDK7083130.1 helix-turn-helix domain-containing protein [Pseudoglutamicibacter cumminsii]